MADFEVLVLDVTHIPLVTGLQSARSRWWQMPGELVLMWMGIQMELREIGEPRYQVKNKIDRCGGIAQLIERLLRECEDFCSSLRTHVRKPRHGGAYLYNPSTAEADTCRPLGFPGELP